MISVPAAALLVAQIAQTAPADPVRYDVIGAIFALLALGGAGLKIAWGTVEKFLGGVTAQVTAAYSDNKTAMHEITDQLATISTRLEKSEGRSAVRHQRIRRAIERQRHDVAEDFAKALADHTHAIDKRVTHEFRLLREQLGLRTMNDSQDDIEIPGPETLDGG